MEEILFCCMCFASEDSSSWGETLIEGHCFNCGAGGSTKRLPRYFVESIRSSASWVGKRYYPNEEDFVASEERKRLRALTTGPIPGRTAEKTYTREGEVWDGSWCVTQKTPKGGTSQFFKADTAEEAIELSRTQMVYYTEEDLR